MTWDFLKSCHSLGVQMESEPPLHCKEDAQACRWAPGPGFSSPEVQIPCSATLELQVRAVETSFANQLISGRDRKKIQGP